MRNKVATIIIVVIFLALLGTVIGLSVVFSRAKGTIAENKNILEAHYQQAYFTLLDETNDMEIQFTKLAVAGGVTTEREYLEKIVVSSEVAVNSLSALSSEDINVETTTKFINQAGDFSKYLLNKINNGRTITDEEKASVLKIRDMFITLGTSLSKVQDELDNGRLFTSVDIQSSGLYDIFNKLNDNSVEYPTLIYDGPFSDARASKEVKGLSGADIDENTGETIIKSIFKEKASDISFIGEVDGDIKQLTYSLKLSGNDANISLAKQGGLILYLSSNREVTDTYKSEEECITIGKDFITSLGIYDMTDVWVTNDNSIYYINYAPKINGIIMYPDLIKVKIAGDNGEILGIESLNYAYNHQTRNVSATISEETARAKITISGATTGRLTVIPYKTSDEKLCYEYIVENNGTYYIYIDANTGEEINILYVLSTSGGTKLI